MDVLSTVISTIIASMIGMGTALYVNKKSDSRIQEQSFNSQLDHLIDISIEYPYLEEDGFCSNWTNNPIDEKYMRYDNYCCYVFNLLERIYVYFNGDKIKMGKVVYFEEYIHRHQKWFMSEPENSGGYSAEFNNFVKTFLDKGGDK